VAGTGTEVGKTWVACRVAAELRRAGLVVAARKPVQSSDPADPADPATDSDALAAATGEDTLVVCPAHRRLPMPMAPPMAADALGLPQIALADLVAEVGASWPARVDVGMVELAGGLRSPMAHDGDGRDLLAALDPDVVVVVADAGLGTLNAVLTTLDSLRAACPDVAVAVHLNRFVDGSDLHARNRAHLTAALDEAPTTSVAALARRLATGA
jgi:dethiobiotin synthetase